MKQLQNTEEERKLRVVFDTNIFVSALNWSGKPWIAYLRWLNDEFILVTSTAILSELCDILRRDFNWSDDDAYDIYNLIGSLSIVVTPTERIEVIEQDPDDNRILECAVEGNVNYIVSGDRHLLDLGRYRGIEIITTSEFLFLL
jgi:putative PIN family toxin of toxin-antitoxin system